MENRLAKLMKTKARAATERPSVKTYELSESNQFPFVVEAMSSGQILSTWIEDNQAEFDQKMTQYGAVLFRNFEINTVVKFQRLMRTFIERPLEYKMRTSPRFAVGDNVYVTTTYPQDRSINMHSESSYDTTPPKNIAFCCLVSAEEQGETPIADNRKVLSYFSPELRRKFKDKGVQYVRKINDKIGLPWQEIFQTDDRSEVEAVLDEKNIQYQWNGDNELIMSWKKPAIVNHEKTNEEVWFNHAYFFHKYAQDEDILNSVSSASDLPYNSFFGDGEEISKDEILEIKEAYEKSKVVFPWRPGDIIFLDNTLVSHGRNPYKGERKVIVSIY